MVTGDAAKALAGVRALKKMINVEYKTKNEAIGTTPDTTGLVSTITNMAQGDDIDDRDGNKIKSFSLKISGNCLLHVSARATNVRIMAIQDRSGTATAPVITDMYASVAAFANNQPTKGTPQVNSRFRILIDKKINLSDNGRQLTNFTLYKKLGFHCFFSGSASGDEGRNAIYLFTASNEATNKPTLSALTQFKWIDN